MNNNYLNWLKTAYGKQYLATELPHIRQALRQMSGPNVLQVGRIINNDISKDLDFPLITRLAESQAQIGVTSVRADAAFLPFNPDVFSGIILSHVMERNENPHQVLREVHRTLMPEGCVIITGFNPFSLYGLQSLINRKARFSGNYYSLKRMKDWIKLLGLEVVGSSMYQYAPLSKHSRIRKALKFLEPVGDRWLPMTGGGYIIIAKKREAGITLIGKSKRRAFLAKKPKRAMAAKVSRKS